MQTVLETSPVEDSVPKINDDLAVGEDLQFQRRWWRFESATWWFFGMLVIMDVAGCFGRGPLAYARWEARDQSMVIKYERIERLGTPSMMSIEFGQNAIRDGKVQLLISESLVKDLGTQRVIPQPASSQLGGGNILYTFPATAPPATVQLGLQPVKAGLSHLIVRVPGFDAAKMNIYVAP